MGDGGQRAHGAGGDNHAVHGKRAAGHGRAEVADGVDGVGEAVDIIFAVGRFEGAGEFGAFADNQVAFDVGQGAQDFEGGAAVLEAAGAADADDDAACVHGLSFRLCLGARARGGGWFSDGLYAVRPSEKPFIFLGNTLPFALGCEKHDNGGLVENIVFLIAYCPLENGFLRSPVVGELIGDAVPAVVEGGGVFLFGDFVGLGNDGGQYGKVDAVHGDIAVFGVGVDAEHLHAFGAGPAFVAGVVGVVDDFGFFVLGAVAVFGTGYDVAGNAARAFAVDA